MRTRGRERGRGREGKGEGEREEERGGGGGGEVKKYGESGKMRVESLPPCVLYNKVPNYCYHKTVCMYDTNKQGSW